MYKSTPLFKDGESPWYNDAHSPVGKAMPAAKASPDAKDALSPAARDLASPAWKASPAAQSSPGAKWDYAPAVHTPLQQHGQTPKYQDHHLSPVEKLVASPDYKSSPLFKDGESPWYCKML